MKSANYLERPVTVEQFQKMFRHIYQDVNRKKYKETDKLVARLIEEITKLMEHARKDRRSLFRAQLANIFSWHMGVANRLDIKMQEAVWHKYPGVCPYCLKGKDCICGTEHPIVEEKELCLRRLRRERAGREPATLVEHQELHARLYAWQHDRELPIVIAAHLIEEAGEVSEAYRHFVSAGSSKGKEYWWNMLRGEMADIDSWMFALATRLEFDLADAIWEYYPYECVKCHEAPCVCPEVI